MGVNIAILIGVTNYVEVNNQLPACKNDVSIVAEILNASGKFSEVFVVPSEDAKTLKASVAEYVAAQKGKEIDELFFYYTGHGDFKDDQFRYLLRDFTSSKPAQTSLSNDELDNFLRSLAPKLVVKVVDACHSGMPYIKDGSSFVDYMKAATEATFDKCYFLFSSQSDQSSWASRQISDFTKIFASSVAESSVDSVRYKDVLDFISDAFIGESKQRPMFVVQSDFTEIFGEFPKPARDVIKQRLQATTSGAAAKDPVQGKSLAQLVKEASDGYVSMEEAMHAIADLKSCIETCGLPPIIEGIFSKEAEFFEGLNNIPNKITLGKWLSKSESEFFASPKYKVEEYEVDNPFHNTFSSIIGGAKKVTRTRRIISGVASSVSGLPFLACRVDLIPKFPNVTKYSGWIAFFLSKKSIQLFYCFVEHKEITWGDYQPLEKSEWSPVNSEFKEFGGGKRFVQIFTESFGKYVSTSIAAKLGVSVEDTRLDVSTKVTRRTKETG